MELDHIFIFTKEAEQVAVALQQFGLAEGTSNVHPGQGTASRRFFFHNAYLELLWVTGEHEIKSPATINTRLWERSQYLGTNYCPFGLCFRKSKHSDNDATLFENGWHYKPLYLPNDLYINIASNDDFPAEPMLFEFPLYRSAPKDYPVERQQPLNHKAGFQEITRLNLTLATSIDRLSVSMQKVINNSIVSITEGQSHHVTLEFGDCRKEKKQNFDPLVPLSLRW